MPNAHNRLLVFTQDATYADALRVLLENFDYQLTICSNLAAMRRHQPSHYACVFADVSSEAHKVFTYISELYQANAALPPILYAANEDNLQLRLDAIRAHGSGFILKNTQHDLLIEKVYRICNQLTDSKPRVLVIDSQKTLAEQYAAILTQGGMLAEYQTDPEQILPHLQRFTPDIILLDKFMPGYSGSELAELIRQFKDFLSIPIVFTASSKHSQQDLTGLLQGVDNCLLKPIEPEHLLKVLRLKVQRAQKLNQALYKDSMTGLLNHAQINGQIKKDIERAQRAGTSLSVAMVDIDHLKQVNDTFDHSLGDIVIRNLAHLLAQRTRTSDTVGRYGGEEFMVILYDCDQDNAFNIMDDIRCRFELMTHNFNGDVIRCTFSCGIASFPLIRDPTKLISEADKALGQAKKAGRNQTFLANTLANDT